MPREDLRVGDKTLNHLIIDIVDIAKDQFIWYWGGNTTVWEDGARDFLKHRSGFPRCHPHSKVEVVRQGRERRLANKALHHLGARFFGLST